jgi:hypothetical protein
MTQKDLAFFRNSLNNHFDMAFEYGQINWKTCARIKSWSGGREAREYARLLFRDQAVDIPAQLVRTRPAQCADT